eukprot:CAMPEP_0196159902 /NCGR_PEP_ID=MMETSP0910-20130528/46554_1 /TAXON_ID=49265 /ORGANISM="Thalassiosira rotula, Strain GSO102" /LENGTH=188 /DNA_ID=CAMNT_0041424827 /DNA_START=255 /DNA_END=817 /DNA_ORIENTATION=+
MLLPWIRGDLGRVHGDGTREKEQRTIANTTRTCVLWIDNSGYCPQWYEESMLNCCVDLEEVKTKGVTIGTVACLAKCQGLAVDAVYGSNSTVAEFRRVVKRTCTAPSATTTQPTSFLVVSYTRKVIGQTGSGHFSPIGAYDEASDHVLILDTARFKYGPHWVSLPLMFEALLPIDPATGKSRGYMVLG